MKCLRATILFAGIQSTNFKTPETGVYEWYLQNSTLQNDRRHGKMFSARRHFRTQQSCRRSDHHTIFIFLRNTFPKRICNNHRAMMKLVLPFALFFVIAVEGSLRGDLFHDDKRRRHLKMNCNMMSKFDSWSLLLSMPFR
jgi:hypothetical protein